MSLKLLGGILIIISSGLFGLIKALRYANRPKELQLLRNIFQMLETEIIYTATPLPIAFFNISKKADPPFDTFFYDLFIKLQKREASTVYEAWNSAVTDIINYTSLQKGDLLLLLNFGKVLGISDREDQIKHFKLLYVQLTSHIDSAEWERKKSEKLYGSLGFLVGMLIFIILI